MLVHLQQTNKYSLSLIILWPCISCWGEVVLHEMWQVDWKLWIRKNVGGSCCDIFYGVILAETQTGYLPKMRQAR